MRSVIHRLSSTHSTLKRVWCLALAAAAALVSVYHRGGGERNFAVRQPLIARRRPDRSATFASAAGEHPMSGSLDGARVGESSRMSVRRTKKKAVATRLGMPGYSDSSFRTTLQNAGKGLFWSLATASGLLLLLIMTSLFEKLMHSTSGLLSGQSPWRAAIIGIAVGTLHTVAGPDHLASLAPMVVGRRRSLPANFTLGALWGSGHATGQLIIGLACLLVKVGLLQFSWADTLGQLTGWLVGMSLIAIGALGVKEVLESEKDGGHGGHGHAHAHVHQAPVATGTKSRYFGWATYATGVLHGLSPDAIVFIIPALALPRGAAVAHVAGVLIGTLVSMGGCTMLLGALCRRSPKLNRISVGAAGVAILLGLAILLGEMGYALPLPGL